MKFFVLLDQNEEMCDIFHVNKLCVYEKRDTWRCVKCYKVESLYDSSRHEVEQCVNKIVTIIKQTESTMIIGSDIVGVPYQIFNKHDINMCEADSLSEELLDAIHQDFYEQDSDMEEAIEEFPPYPICIKDGFYYFHFDKAMKAHKELSSKKMLIPFLQQEAFTCLTIQCSHIMPWLDYYVEQHHLIMESKRESSEYIVNVRSGYCG